MTQSVKYKKDDRVRLVADPRDISRELTDGEEGVHTGRVSDNGFEIVDFPNYKGAYMAQDEIELVLEDPLVSTPYEGFGVERVTIPVPPLDPRYVKPGDAVTLTRGDASVTARVTHVQDFLHLEDLGRFNVRGLPHRDGRTAGYSEWTLTDHQPAPEPKPEWKPGTVAIVVSGGDPGAGVEDTEFQATLHTDGLWVSLDGEEYTAVPKSVRPLVLFDPAMVVDELVDSLSHALGERLPPEAVAYISRTDGNNDRRKWVRGLLNHGQPNLIRSVADILGIEVS